MFTLIFGVSSRFILSALAGTALARLLSKRGDVADFGRTEEQHVLAVDDEAASKGSLIVLGSIDGWNFPSKLSRISRT